MRNTTITSLGNAGFCVEHAERSVLIDPLFQVLPDARRVSLILITHDHWDHFVPEKIAEASREAGCRVIGPQSVVERLKDEVPSEMLIELAPARRGARARVEAGGAVVTAFRTDHGRQHNSYLVELPGFRFLHDGDNEHTDCLDRAALKDLDALMLCPWQGSGWVEFNEAINPKRWFVMHLTQQELDLHERGEFFPELCDHVPAGLIALRPGESWTGSERI